MREYEMCSLERWKTKQERKKKEDFTNNGEANNSLSK